MRGEVFPVLFPDLDSSHLVDTGKACSKTSPEYFIRGFEEPKPPRRMVEGWKCQCGRTRPVLGSIEVKHSLRPIREEKLRFMATMKPCEMTVWRGVPPGGVQKR